MKPSTRGAFAVVAALAGGVFTPKVWAQPAEPTEADRIARRRLLQQATEAQAAGRLADALALAQRAEQLEATAGTRLLVAQLRAQLDQYVEALSSVELCLREVDADRQTTARNRAAIRERCETLLREVRRHVGALVVEVPTGSPGAMRVRLDGVELNPALYGVSRPVTVGEVSIVTTLEGFEAVTQRASVSAGATVRVRVEVPHVAGSSGVTAGALNVSRTPHPAGATSIGSTQRALGIAAGATGVVLVGGAVVAGLMFNGTADDYAAQRCAEVDVTASCQDQFDRLGTLNTLQWIGYVSGGALIATGVTLLLMAPRARGVERAWRCGVGPGTVGVACGLRF